VSLLKRGPKFGILAIWLTSFAVALALNGPGEVRSPAALVVIGATVTLFALSSAIVYWNAKIRAHIVSSEKEYGRRRTHLLALIIVSAVVAAACFWNAV
jgi:Na+/melibiose symporter-like transporter